MENASKALIIAGAILLAILIISLGIMVYNNARNTVGSSNLDSQSISSFNSQWENYAGTNKTASEVRTLISALISSNASETNSGTGRTVTFNGSLPDGSTLANYYDSTSGYTITPAYDSTTGLITNITVTQS